MKTVIRVLVAAVLVVLTALDLSAQQSAVGEWIGVLSTPNGALNLIVRIRTNPDGSYAGELESPDQAPGQKIPLTTVTVSPNKLAFAISALGATYSGEWKDSLQGWSGVFEQGMAIPLVLKRAPPPGKSFEGLDGTWRALLQRDTTTLHLVLHVRTTPRGTGATLDSPDLGALGLTVQEFDRVGDTVSFRVPDAHVAYKGTLNYATRTVAGQWSRQGMPAAQVAFTRDAVTGRAPRTLTQEPIVAKGYRAEDVSFANPADASVTLAGTLTIPDGRGPFPAAILLSGSGPEDRDETLFGHKPFAVLADHLSRNGIAVLRYDDRGFAKSTGNHARATSLDFATDANAAFRFLADRAEIKRDAIGFVGHSEGGMIGPIAAASNDRVAFMVMLAGPGTDIVQLLLSQRRLIATSQGASDELLDKTEPIIRDILRVVRSARDSASALEAVRSVLPAERLQSLGATEAQRDAIAATFTTTWMRYFIKYDPAPNLARLRVPVLAINGSRDRQVPPVENLAAIRVALKGNRDVTVKELDGLNHLFQTAETGAVSEYERLPETFAPAALDLISDWIRTRFVAR
jgi:pimeloyl-ACP methyl ester carboxylesterase